ncbi:MAG: hypothetical protein BMS9Abin15_0763 [Gammaproteobacteria bacterium]|nr:MAG: hypothetical protein BMS9Abin15_0763 [Gammaproteobacteria bacterium]
MTARFSRSRDTWVTWLALFAFPEQRPAAPCPMLLVTLGLDTTVVAITRTFPILMTLTPVQGMGAHLLRIGTGHYGLDNVPPRPAQRMQRWVLKDGIV